MTKKEKNILAVVAIAALLLIPAGMASGDYISILKTFIPGVEGFSATPIWDYKQWSWGYGTAAGYDPNKKPSGTITREKAWLESSQVIQDHYSDLKPSVTKTINSNQWAALLSFSYNVGTGSARNIIDTINKGSTADVITRMKKYIYADGKVNQGLINRRQKETDLYQGLQSYRRNEEMQDQPLEWIAPERITDYAY